MKFLFFIFVIFFSTISCSNVNFLLDANKGSDFLKNKTAVHVSGWNNPVLKEVLFLKFGESAEKHFILTAIVSETQTKRSVNENQVAQKIDYKITIDYSLVDTTKGCPDINNKQISNFSFTPKSSGYNFASDVLLQNLYEEAIKINVNEFIALSNDLLRTYMCLDEV